MEVRNEFAAVDLRIDTAANAPRLHIRDLETGLSCYIDAFVLRSLVLAPPEALADLCRSTAPGDPPADAVVADTPPRPDERAG